MTRTIPKLIKKYNSGQKLTMVTGYDATFAKLIDLSDIDIILVGDSLGMVMQGLENTLPVTIDDIVYHTKCVTRVAKNSLIVADMPFMSYQASTELALINAGRLLKEGLAQAVKLEGGSQLKERVQAMVAAGIPVMGHIGLQPQAVHQMGGYKIQGKTDSDIEKLRDDARVLEAAGAFAIVLEGITIDGAALITQDLSIPTIGIAAGPHCDGQVQVMQDLFGLNPEWQPKHSKPYLNLAAQIQKALKIFSDEVQKGAFPTEEHASSTHLKEVKKESA